MTRTERYAKLRECIDEENKYIGSLESRIEDLEEFVEILECRLSEAEDYIANLIEEDYEEFNHCEGCTDYDECNCGYKDEDDCYCEGDCTKCHINNGCEECCNADHRKQRGRTAPNCCCKDKEDSLDKLKKEIDELIEQFTK